MFLFKKKKEVVPEVPVNTEKLPGMQSPESLDEAKRKQDLELLHTAEQKANEIKAEGIAILQEVKPKDNTKPSEFGYIPNPFRDVT